MPNTRISMCITSCARPELLKQTLESFFNVTDVEPQEVLIYEDSNLPKPEFLNDFIWKVRNVHWIPGGERRGQMFAVAELIRRAQYEYTFWCEEDWLFLPKNTQFMRRSKEILDSNPDIIQVSLRGDSGWHPLVSDARGFKIAEPFWRGVWGGYSFNPGLRRTSECKDIVLPHALQYVGQHGLGHEADLSKKMLDRGFRIADFGEGIIAHTGGGVSRAVEPLPPMQKILIAIPACFKFEYGAWESGQSPHFDRSKAWNGEPYGTDIHISGVNPRIQAVRETWAKDIEPFKSHVALKFFYGCPPGGFPRRPLPDEVFLEVPDDYEHLIEKTRAICRWAVQNDWDWVFKCDDDTGVYVSRLVSELMVQRGMQYGGYKHGNICSGGPGYWLSKPAMRILGHRADRKHQWAEDVNTGLILNGEGIEAIHLEGHMPGFKDHWFFPNGFNPNKDMTGIVTFHAVQPEVMRAWWKHKKEKE
jgi:hypothetical protein